MAQKVFSASAEMPNRKRRRAANSLAQRGQHDAADAVLKGEDYSNRFLDARRDETPLALLMSDNTAAAWLGISRATFWRRVADGTFPQPVKIGGATRWRRDQLLSAIDHATVAHHAGGAD